MKAVKLVLSVFLVVLVGLSVYGYLWWNHPPEKLAGYETGGHVILVITGIASLFGLWRLWAGQKKIYGDQGY